MVSKILFSQEWQRLKRAGSHIYLLLSGLLKNKNKEEVVITSFSFFFK